MEEGGTKGKILGLGEGSHTVSEKNENLTHKYESQ
jgi:hypothetical protein